MGLLIRNGLVVTPEGGDIRVQQGTIVVEGDRIARLAFGNAAAEVKPGPSDRVIEAKRRLVIPGLVDAHTHFYGTLVPGLIDHLPLDMRMLPLASVTRGLGDNETRVAALLAALRMMRNGTTTVLENVLQGIEVTDAAIRGLVDSGLRAMVGPMIADRPFHETMPGYVERLPEPYRSEALTAPVPSAKDLLDSSLSVASRWHCAQGRIYICLSPSTPHRCTDPLLELIAEAAHTHKLSVHTHLLETRVQVAVSRRLYGQTMVEHIWKLGLLNPGFCGAHSVWLTDGDIELMAEARAGVCHNPLSNLYLGSGIARIPELFRRGVPVGIGSDGPNCASSASLFEVMKLAAVVHRIREDDGREWISARDAFRMATIGGAQALGLDHEIGSLEIGKKADIVLLDTDAPHFVPLNDPVKQLVYSETGSAVETVLVNGEVVFNAGKPTQFDSSEVLGEAAELGRRLRQQAEAGLEEASALKPYLKEAYLALIREFGASISNFKSRKV